MGKVQTPPLFKKGDHVKVVAPESTAVDYLGMEGEVRKTIGKGTLSDGVFVRFSGRVQIFFWNNELQRIL